MAKKRGRVRKTGGSRLQRLQNKLPLVVKNLLLFAGLSIVSVILYNVIQNVILTNLLYIMAIIFGFVAVALLITLLVIWITKIVKK